MKNSMEKRIKINNLQLNIFPEAESMACTAAAEILTQIKQKKESLFTLATGSSPLRTYEILADIVKKEGIDTSRLRIHKLDEWYGIPITNPSSCDTYLKKYIITPLNISNDRYFSVDSQPSDPDKACREMTAILKEEGPVDLCVLGLGVNGHLGLNEPADYLIFDTHLAALSKTSRNHTMLRNEGITVTKGITTGIGEIMRAKKIIFLVEGSEKAAIFREFFTKRITTKFPASFLWLHPKVTCYCDLKSTQLLKL